MRRHDKKIVMLKANMLFEQRNLKQRGLIKENINEDDLTEVEYTDLGEPKDGKWIDAEDILNNPENYPAVENGMVWVHTNRTNVNAGANGGVGLYPFTGKGKGKDTLRDKDGTNVHTNEISLMGPIKFQTSSNGHYKISSGSKRSVHAGFGGKLVPSNKNTGSVPVAYIPPMKEVPMVDDEGSPVFKKNGKQEIKIKYNVTSPPYFIPVEDMRKPFKNRQLIGADSVYFLMTKGGKWEMSVNNPEYREWTKEE